MNFLMTSYVYPLPEKVPLSRTLNAFLDNPRTEEEVQAVTDYIRRSYSVESAFRIPERSAEGMVSLERVLSEICEILPPLDPNWAGLCGTFDNDKLYEFMARTWVVARYDDEGQIEVTNRAHQERRDKGELGFFLFEEEHPIIKNSRQLAEYSYLVSLLLHTQGEEYIGHSFILDSDPSQFGEDESNWHLCREFVMFYFALRQYGDTTYEEEMRWKLLHRAEGRLGEVVELLDSAFQEGHREKLMYVAGLLKTVGEDVSDEKVQLVILVSIIELLLTHSPDYNRFNVEDSISKQFRLKAGLLIYLNDKSRDLDQIKNRLKVIYGLRSNIAHGNFVAVSRYIERLSRREGEEEYFSDLITDLYSYIRAILTEYLRDPALVAFLKEN